MSSLRSAAPNAEKPECPRFPGCGVLRFGDQVKFARAPVGSFAWRTLKPGSTFTVLSCKADRRADIWLRLAEHPGFSFRRTMFDVVA